MLCPDGIIALLHGPVPGSRHDSFMLNDSGILPKLREIMPEASGAIYGIYGDPAYPNSAYILGGLRNVNQGTIEGEWNTVLRKVRQAVEWGFGEIIATFSFLDFKKSMKIFLSPIEIGRAHV